MPTKINGRDELLTLADNDEVLVSDTANGITKRAQISTLVSKVGGATTSTTVTGTSHTADVATPFILVDDDTAGSLVTISLPASASASDKSLYIKKLGSTANVLIDADASEEIDGDLTFTLEAQHESVHLYCNGTFWSII